MGITAEQSTQLKDYFPVKSHEFLNGNTYISEEAITNRLDEVDPSWTLERLDVYRLDSVVTAIFRLTVCGVSRDGVGMASVQLNKDKDREVNEAEKSAATDALKRAARLFGIGRYILEMGKSVSDYASLERWLIQRQRNIDMSTGEISIVDKAAGDYERTPQQALHGNGRSERTIAPKSHSTSPNSSAAPSPAMTDQNGTDEPQNAETREWTATAVTVRKSNAGKPYLQYTCDQGKPTSYGRDMLRSAGYECEDWTQENETYPLTPPAKVTVQKKGNFWNVIALAIDLSKVNF